MYIELVDAEIYNIYCENVIFEQEPEKRLGEEGVNVFSMKIIRPTCQLRFGSATGYWTSGGEVGWPSTGARVWVRRAESLCLSSVCGS